MLELIQTYYRYNAWATEQLLNACEQLTPEEWNAPGCSGNGSTWETLDHLINVQRGWFAWYDGTKEMKDAIKLMLPKDLDTLPKARERWGSVNEQTNAYINALTEESVKEVRRFIRSNGKEEAHPVWKLLMHTANHGTHTRAQVLAAIRRAGHNPGNIDLLNFILNVEGAA